MGSQMIRSKKSTKLLKVGEETRTGHIVERILGQGPNGAVFTTKNNEIRWTYWTNNGRLPDSLGMVVLHFDSLLIDIRSLPDMDEKRALFELAGKTLYRAFESKIPPDPVKAFAEIEERLAGSFGYARNRGANANSADVVIVCALHDPELHAMLTLPGVAEAFYMADDPQTYHRTRWTTANGVTLNVILAAPNQMGLTAAGVLSAKMVLQFRPKLVAMAGIAAGATAGKQGFGDVVTPEHTFDYGTGKSIDNGRRQDIVPSPTPLSINARILGRLKEWQRSRPHLDEIAKGWPSARPGTTLNIHTGPIFSAPTVQGTSKNIERVLSQWRKLSAVEMEAHAVHRACSDTLDPAPMYLCAKSVCDFAVGKNDDWQHYAAYTSANFVYRFITQEWSNLFPPRKK